ncbi:MAG: sulfatase-like hydrolase/transferase [Planctomycetota bacterium]|nr:sulfatase-like hydrolase/transferase [Planctomycetota bacterium]
MLRYGRAENLPHLLHKERRWLALAATGGGMLEPWQHNFLKGFARILSNKSLDPVGRGDGRFTQAQINALWLREGVAEFPAAPLFGFYHTYEPHAPYHDARFAEGLPRGRVAVPFNEGNYLAGGQKALTADYSAEEQAFIGALYDGDVAASDAALDELLRLPGGGSLLDRGWLIVTSDHGEEFWDHGGMSHGHSLYEELLHVPLLIVPPGGLETGVRIAEPVSLLDLFPTACELAGLAPPPNLLGRSLKPLLSPDAEARAKVQLPAPPGLFVHCATYHGPTRWAIRRGNWKYILSLDVETWKKDEANRRMLRLEPEELYDLALDPREEKNLIAEKECAEVRKQLADALALLRATVLKPLELSPDRQAVQPPPLDPALLEQLKKLGY